MDDDDRQPPNLHSDFTLARLQRNQFLFRSDHLNEPTKSNNRSRNPEPISTHEGMSVKECLIACLPTDTKTFLFALVSIVYLMASVMHFFGWTGDSSMLTYLFGAVGSYKGVTDVASAFSRKKKRGDDQESVVDK
jgi:hypothetical protein